MPVRVTREMNEDELLAKAEGTTNPIEPEEVTEQDLEAAILAEEEATAKQLTPGAEEVPEEEVAEEEFSEQQQGKIQALIDRTVAIERRRRERDLKKQFGTSNMAEISELYTAGKAIAAASGRSPKELMQYVQDKTGGASSEAGEVMANSQIQALEAQLLELRNLVAGQHETEVREADLTTARKEFGKLFDEYQMDIEDKADELGVSLTDAAAMVLRPHLHKLTEQRAQAKRQNVRGRKVASTNEGGTAGVGLNLEDLLSPRQKLAAKKMGVSFKDYAQQLKETGLIDR